MSKQASLNSFQTAVLRQYAEGRTPLEIGQAMNLSEFTIIAALQSAVKSLGTETLASATIKFVEMDKGQ